MTLRRRNQILLISFIFIVALLSIAGCARGRSSDTAQTTATSATTPANISANDLKKLLWIEGTWRGTGDVETPFYERYRFENDNTPLVEYLADESGSNVTRTTRYELKDGQFGNDRSVATEISDNYIKFTRAENTFRWQKESADSWKAVLTSPATDNTPARERVYRMERLPPGKR
jgi:hypothetical protein